MKHYAPQSGLAHLLMGTLMVVVAGCGGSPDEDLRDHLGTREQAVTLYTVRCWKASTYDKDSDGYAQRLAPASKRVSFSVPYNQSLTCPAGYVRTRGDCDDNNPGVHPRRTEVFGNGVDDNCNNRVDEPRPLYSTQGIGPGDHGFTMMLRVNDPAIFAAKADKNVDLLYMVTYQRLSDTSVVKHTGTKPVTSLNFGYAIIKLEGLKAAEVYRARLQFFTGKQLGSRYLKSRIGDPSDWYYSATTSPYAVRNARAGIVLQGLYEYSLNIYGAQTGVLGNQLDGTRYGGDVGEWWCSEFYSTVANHRVTIGHRYSVSNISEYFKKYGAFFDLTPAQAAAANYQPGDYLAVDTGTDGVANHSAMVLAFDRHKGRLFTLEGNTHGANDWNQDGKFSFSELRLAGNETIVMTRDPSDVVGMGVMAYDMLY